MMEKTHFKLVEALEQNVDVWSLGRDKWEVPLHNIYVPVRHTIMPRPSMNDTKADELAYRYSKPDDDRPANPTPRIDYTA